METFFSDDVNIPQKKTDPRFYVFRNAVYESKQEAEQILADDPSILEVQSGIGETVLHFLAVEDEIESVAWLVERGARIDSMNDFGDTPLMDAAALNYAALCRYLIDRGANFRYINEENETSIYSTAATGSTPALAALKVLLEYLPTDEDINEYFDEWARQQVKKQGGEAFALLVARGLEVPKE